MHPRARFTVLLVAALLATAHAAHAERPLAVDDASVLDLRATKLEAGWRKDGAAKGFDTEVGYGPLPGLELALGFGRLRDDDAGETLRAWGLAAKWVPLATEEGLSAGLKAEFGRGVGDAGARPREARLLALVTWAFGDERPALHVNAGREWTRADGARDHANLWGVALDVPLTGSLQLVMETFGRQHAGPNRAAGLRYTLVEGLKISAAYGRGNDRIFANAGIAWEF